MKRTSHALPLLAVVTAALALAGCGGVGNLTETSGSPAPLQVTYASFGESVGFVATVTKSLQAAADAAGVELSVLDNQNDAATAVDNARQAATTDPDVFIEYNGNADSNSRVASLMADASIPVIAVQYPIEGAPLFAIDNTQVGEIGGSQLAAAAQEKWGEDETPAALIVTLPQGGPIQLDRSEGAKAAISDTYPDIEFTDVDSRSDAAVGRQLAADFLTSHPDEPVIIWAHVDSVGLGVVAAVEASGRDDVLVMSTGGDAAIFPEIRKAGTPLVGTVGLFPESWGSVLIDLAQKVAAGEEVPEVTHPEKIEVISAANIGQLYPE
ncbi:sugar ABC transporter substrate-binding protein [Microbacterium sp. LWS13-1.2]|uniref:Sugar ABC transporter substrate-binding protein n=1 Tax=Microbacterium sp. LWS13-1.2 TaxID=3135264 RepID=A0AAU6SBP8_9MICO